MPSSTKEDYLKTIYLESCRMPDPEGLVPPGCIADSLGLTAGTVTTMLKQLAQQDLLVYEPRKGVRLSESGYSLAVAMVRRHRLLELFLTKFLDYSWDQVHQEAELMEHAVSDFFIQRIDDLLGNPEFDPHGSPIPSADGQIPQLQGMRLIDASVGKFVLLRVFSESPSLLRWLSDSGLMPNVEFEMTAKDSVAGTLSLITAKGAQVVSLNLARHLLVREAP